MQQVIFSFTTGCLAFLWLCNPNVITQNLIAKYSNANNYSSTNYLQQNENIDPHNLEYKNIYTKRNYDRILPERITRYQRRNISYQEEEENSSINLDSGTLRQANNLVISADPGTQITGQITLDGKVIKLIRGNRTAINLSNCLSKGRHAIQIFGNYRPTSSSVQVEFSGSGTRVSQATGGSGTIRQTLIIDVR